MAVSLVKVYVFDDESMCEDLLESGVEVEDLNKVADNILEMLRLGKFIEFDGSYITGNISAMILKESYGINTIIKELVWV